MLKHAGELARELFQDTLFDRPPSRLVERHRCRRSAGELLRDGFTSPVWEVKRTHNRQEAQTDCGDRAGVDATMRGSIEAMRYSLRSFALGLSLSVILLYLVLVAQFRSFTDPFLILLAFPPGVAGALLTLWLTGTPLNVMSLMGLVMLAGITMSDSILITEYVEVHRRRYLSEPGLRDGDENGNSRMQMFISQG